MYYASQGDPGIFGTIGRAIGGAVTGFATGGIPGAIAGGARGITGRGRSIPQLPSGYSQPGMPVISRDTGQGPSGKTPFLGLPIAGQRRRRRMNYGNTKALRRADRRIDGFVKVARGALKHTNYKVVSKSAGSRGGSRGVITRREASRALSR